jgi:alkanesulfonate monooxygenase SsuD/methylene tetrahydromethanopterin reductase-like flavin-dependent oxidoreductase (luciferase family)
MAYFGVEPQDSGKIYFESYSVIMQGMTSREINFEGERFQFKNVPVVLETVQKPHPPIWYGMSRPDAVPWAAQNGLNIVCNGPAAPVTAITARYRDEWKAHHKSDERFPFMGLGRHIVVADSYKEAYDIGKRGFDHWYDSLQHLWRLHDNPMKNYSIPADYAAAVEGGMVLVGTPQDVADQLRREIEISGVNYILTRFAFGNITYDESLRSLTLFAKHVMPQFM